MSKQPFQLEAIMHYTLYSDYPGNLDYWQAATAASNSSS
jgi:hypothetical protein